MYKNQNWKVAVGRERRVAIVEDAVAVSWWRATSLVTSAVLRLLLVVLAGCSGESRLRMRMRIGIGIAGAHAPSSPAQRSGSPL